MPLEHFDRFFVLAALGIGLLLVGGLNLLLRGRPWLRAGLSVAVGGTVLAGLVALTRPELAVRAGCGLFAVLAVIGLLGSGWVARQVTALVNAVRKPSVRWGLVTVAGLLLLVGAGIAFERDDEQATADTMRDLDMTVGRPPSQPTERAKATGDRGTAIVLKEPISPRDAGTLAEAEFKVLASARLTESVMRRGAASDQTNCHGWVFTGGQYLLSGEDVEVILKENGYWEVTEPHAGDLVVYRQSGSIAHTGIVRYVSEGQPVLVESKWGVMGVFLHEADKSCYGSEITFYRNARGSHKLVAFGGSPAAPNAPRPGAAAAE
jgi:hypothetical protein